MGLPEDGGLFVPEEIPRLAKPLEELSALSYQQLAVEIMGKFLTDFTREELEACAKAAYDSKFDTPQIAPLAKCGDHYFLELFHGATLAFKDMALSILPHLLKCSAQKQKLDKKIVILTATSGDTGKAAHGGPCQRGGRGDHRLLPEGRGQPYPETADGDTERGQYPCGSH